ncbi:MAG: helix-turn-helix domain-containing protein [Oleiphilaceae bacterium]|nr:helix-turn-helix domain-containing protein [Oleiphilaceae bacterium]
MVSEENLRQPAQETVGEQLRKAREAASLKVSDIAEGQHLRPVVIEAIERSDYRQVDSEIFLKGYVRTYANQVGLPADALVAQLNQELEPLRREREDAEEINPLQDIQRKKARKKRVARVVIFSLVIVGLAYGAMRLIAMESEGLLSSVFKSSDDIAETGGVADDTLPERKDRVPPEDDLVLAEPESSQTEGQTTGPIEQEAPLPDESERSGPDAGTTTVPETSPAEEPEVMQPLPLQSDSPAEDNAPVEDVAPETESAEPLVDLSESQEPAVDGSLDQAPAMATDRPIVESRAESGRAEGGEESRNVSLSASFSDACWVQVTSADGRTLVSSLYRDGDTLELDAEPPLRVVLGAADAVSRLAFRGELVDLSAYRIVNNRVEFTLDI